MSSEVKFSKFAAIFEVLGIYVGGQVLAFILGKLLGFPLQNPLASIQPGITPDILQLSLALLKVLVLQYTGLFVLVFAINWWRKRYAPTKYGLTLSGKSFKYLALVGVGLFAFSELPSKLLLSINDIHPLGPEVPWRSMLHNLPMDFNYWLFVFVGSFGLVPFLEELFYRGYCQTRLEEDLGAPAAILATAALFTFSHSQYYGFTFLSVSSVLTLLFSALAAGFVFYKTRSLVPTVVAHTLINFPTKGVWSFVVLALMLLISFKFWKEISTYVREFSNLVKENFLKKQVVLTPLFFTAFAVGFVLLGDIVLLLGLLFLVLALIFEAVIKLKHL